MGIFKKIFKGVGKVFKKIGRGVKKVFKKFGKFMGKIGIAGQIAMMFILPGVGAALMRGFGSMWTGVVGQTAAQATATSIGTAAGTSLTTTASVDLATKAAAAAGKTAAQQVAAGEVAKQVAIKAATKTATAGIRAGTQAITQQATGMLASELAIVRGAGMVLQKGAQFASTISSGYQTVSQAVTGAFTETGKWIGGKLGMKTAEGVAMKGSWANYSQAVTDSFTDFKGNVSDFWSPIKDGPTLDVGLDNLTKKATDVTGGLNVSGEFGTGAAAKKATDVTGGLNVSGEFGTGAGAENLVPEINVSGEFGTGAAVPKQPASLLDKGRRYFSENAMGGRTFSESLAELPGKAKNYVVETPGRILGEIAATPGRLLKDGVNDMIFGQEPLEIEEERAGLYGNYVPEFRGDGGFYAQVAEPVAAPISGFSAFVAGNEETFGNYGVKEGQFGGADAYKNYFKRLQNFGAIS